MATSSIKPKWPPYFLPESLTFGLLLIEEMQKLVNLRIGERLGCGLEDSLLVDVHSHFSTSDHAI